MNAEVVLNRQFVTAMQYSPCQNYLGVATENQEMRSYGIVVYSIPNKFKISSLLPNAHSEVIKDL